jgi:hypothetical protein
MRRMLIYVYAPNGCLVLRESADFDVQAWFDSRVASGAFKLLGITRVEWEVL